MLGVSYGSIQLLVTFILEEADEPREVELLTLGHTACERQG